MDHNKIQSLEKLFHKKIMLYNDLLDCLKNERKSLASIDLDRLWVISKEKEQLSIKIKSLRQEISFTAEIESDKRTFDINKILAKIPEEKRDIFMRLNLATMKLKNEIEVLRKENMNFIDDSLKFLDEVISIIAGKNGSADVYNNKSQFKKIDHSMLMNREV